MAPEPEPVRAPPGAVGGSGGCDAPSEGAEAPPGPSVAPPAPIDLEPAPEGLSAAERAVRQLQQRLRLNALVQRLHDARPKQRHGVRRLDFDAWTVAAQAAARLPGDQWMAWRHSAGTDGAAWPPGHAAHPLAGEAHR